MINVFEFDKPTSSSRLQTELTIAGLASVVQYVHVKFPNLTRIGVTDTITPQQESTLSGVMDAHILDLCDDTPLLSWDQEAQNPLASGDYKFIRSQIANEVAASGWGELSDQGKEIAARWFVVSAEKRNEIYTTDEQVTLGIHFHAHSVKSRSARYQVASVEIFNRLSRPEQMIVTSEVEQSALPRLYVEYGVEGTPEDNTPGLFDYMLGRDDTPWAGSGLLQKNFQPSGMTMTQLVDKVMNVLVSGLYNHHQFQDLTRD